MLPLDSLKNIDIAAKKILNGIKNNQKFVVWADSDSDGIMSGTIMYKYLKNYTDNCFWRINQGKAHGLIGQDLESFNEDDIIIMVDAGASDYECHKILYNRKVQLVILDHHDFEDYSEFATLVSSAKEYENPYLSGSGVTFKFCCYLDKLTGQEYSSDYDLTAIGILADVSPVDERSYENRYLVFKGLNNLNNLAARQIISNYDFNSTSVIYSIAPLINSSQRNGKNYLAMELFLSEDRSEIIKLIQELKDIKTQQDEQVKQTVNDVNFQIRSTNWQKNKVVYAFIDASEHAGLIAGKTAEMYGRPCMIFHNDPEGVKFKGSMRGYGIPDFKNVIEKTKLAWVGGHANAAGVQVYKDNFEKFVDALNQNLKNVQFMVTQEADVILKPSDITPKLIEKIAEVNKVSGQGFKPIAVVIENLEPDGCVLMQNKHSKFSVDGIECIKWNDSNLAKELQPEEDCSVSVDVLGTLQLSNFAGKKSKQVIIQDYKVKQILDFLKDVED